MDEFSETKPIPRCQKCRKETKELYEVQFGNQWLWVCDECKGFKYRGGGNWKDVHYPKKPI